MAEALEILDEVDAPGEIGSTLDLAIERVAKRLSAFEADDGDRAAVVRQGNSPGAPPPAPKQS